VSANQKEFEKDLYAYMGAIIRNQGHIPVRINGISDHVHILFIQKPIDNLSALMREVKSETSRIINEKGWVKSRFRWQVGFGAFSCDHHNVEKIDRYIVRQKEHHAGGITFREEYVKFLDDYQVDWNQQYIED